MLRRERAAPANRRVSQSCHTNRSPRSIAGAHLNKRRKPFAHRNPSFARAHRDPPRRKCVNHLSRAGYLSLANKTPSHRARPNHPNLKRACKKGNHVCEECVVSENKRRTTARARARMSALIRAPFRSESR
jgi:hypothetical protein